MKSKATTFLACIASMLLQGGAQSAGPSAAVLYDLQLQHASTHDNVGARYWIELNRFGKKRVVTMTFPPNRRQ